MAAIAFEVVFILLLLIANGLFAMSELAIVSARKARLQRRAGEGDTGACAALKLAEEPGNLLSTVQIGITLIGVMAGAFGGATIAEEMVAGLSRLPFLAPYSEALSVGLVVVVITYLTLVVGELAPKRLALNNPERVASLVARPMQALARIAAPLVRLLNLSTDLVLRLLGVRPAADPPVTEEEIRLMLEQGTEVGIFEPIEEEMVEHVFRLGDRKLSAMLTPRTEIVWIDVDEPADQIRAKLLTSGHSRFPVAQGGLDDVRGVVLAKDLLAQTLEGKPLDPQAVLRPVPFVPETMPALDVLEHFRQGHSKIALVLDEYGGLQGLVTTDDVLVAIVGDLPGLGEAGERETYQREDGSWLLGGLLPLDEFGELFGLKDLPVGGTETLGGLVMTLLGRIPTAGDRLEWQGLHLEIVDMDGRRVDKVLAKSLKPPAEPDHCE
jgi:putative hemolysin